MVISDAKNIYPISIRQVCVSLANLISAYAGQKVSTRRESEVRWLADVALEGRGAALLVEIEETHRQVSAARE